MNDHIFELLTVKEYAAMMRVTPRTVRDWIRRGHLDVDRRGDGGHFRIRVAKSGLSVGAPVTRHKRGVYFLACGEFIKIGKAADVCTRYGTIQTSTPYDVVPLGWIPADDASHLTAIEKDAHRTFAEYRHRGEWFLDHVTLREFIASHAQEWPSSKRATAAA